MAPAANGAASKPRPKSAARAPARAPGAAPGALAHVAALTDPSAAVSIAVNQINKGIMPDALEILDRVIAGAAAPNGPAHLARGTARAMNGQLEGERAWQRRACESHVQKAGASHAAGHEKGDGPGCSCLSCPWSHAGKPCRLNYIQRA